LAPAAPRSQGLRRRNRWTDGAATVEAGQIQASGHRPGDHRFHLLGWSYDALLGSDLVAIIVSAILSWLFAFDVINHRNRFVNQLADFLDRVTGPVLDAVPPHNSAAGRHGHHADRGPAAYPWRAGLSSAG
jgi:hypothetical protein